MNGHRRLDLEDCCGHTVGTLLEMTVGHATGTRARGTDKGAGQTGPAMGTRAHHRNSARARHARIYKRVPACPTHAQRPHPAATVTAATRTDPEGHQHR